ncbi:hypothetical protein TNCV_4639541 [Trichonephila clavipes]|nr:hypothetical protein TNCV_4639541 [Trichonephila clavipes]
MALMDHAATSRALSQELGSLAKQQMSSQTVRQRLQQYGFFARRPWLRLLLTCITDMRVFNGVINDEPGSSNGETLFFQMNPGSVNSIKMVAPMFGGIG